jgi:hypothetical protein
MTFPHSAHEWFVVAERGALRLAMVTIGFILMVAGLALGVSMVMLPMGVFVGLTGFLVFLWGALGDLPVEK